jgi:hypothetical protein
MCGEEIPCFVLIYFKNDHSFAVGYYCRNRLQFKGVYDSSQLKVWLWDGKFSHFFGLFFC